MVVAAEDVDEVGVEGVVEVSNDVVDITLVSAKSSFNQHYYTLH